MQSLYNWLTTGRENNGVYTKQSRVATMGMGISSSYITLIVALRKRRHRLIKTVVPFCFARVVPEDPQLLQTQYRPAS